MAKKDKNRDILHKIKYIAYKDVYEACMTDSMMVDLPKPAWQPKL